MQAQSKLCPSLVLLGFLHSIPAHDAQSSTQAVSTNEQQGRQHTTQLATDKLTSAAHKGTDSCLACSRSFSTTRDQGSSVQATVSQSAAGHYNAGAGLYQAEARLYQT